MKPFFAIRIDYNPADSDDQDHRDENTVRFAVARQCHPSVMEGADEESRAEAAVADDRKAIVDRFASAVRFADRAMNDGDDWSLLDEVMKALLGVYGGLSTVRYLLDTVIDEADEDDLEELQAIIDRQRTAPPGGDSVEPDA
jgi:hypothetical protein